MKYKLIRHHCHKKRGTILGVFLDFGGNIYLWATLTHLQCPPQGFQQGQDAVKSPDHLALRSNTSNGNLSVHSEQGCSMELLTNTNMTMTVQTSRPSSKNNYSRSSMTSIISFNIISLSCWWGKKTIPGWDHLSVWNLHILPMSVCIFSRSSSFRPHPKDVNVRLIGMSTLSQSEWMCVWMWVHTVMEGCPVQGAVPPCTLSC